MACQPAVHVGALFKMTRDTFIHIPGLMRQALQVLHLPVAFGAGNFAVDVALVVKQYMFGYIIKLYPGRGRIGVKILVFLFDPGMVGDNIVMAVQTFFHCRDPGMIGIGHVGVAVLTLDLLHPAVNIVAEGNRLLRPNVAVRHLEKQENKHRNGQSGDQCGQDDDCIFTQGFNTSLNDRFRYPGEPASAVLENPGKRFKKKLTAMTINPKKPTVINPSETFNDSECAPWLSAGASNSRCSNQNPMIMTLHRITIKTGFDLIFLLIRITNGMMKQTIKTVQASWFQGIITVRSIT